MLRITGPTGASRVDADGYLQGAPELIVEIAASTVSIDLHRKWHVYRRAGVREYLVLRGEDAAIDWFVRRRGAYERLGADPAGILRSEVFPGLWLHGPALLADDGEALHAALAAGLATAEHAGFAERIRGS